MLVQLQLRLDEIINKLDCQIIQEISSYVENVVPNNLSFATRAYGSIFVLTTNKQLVRWYGGTPGVPIVV